jgi:hypothetical protein
VFLKQPVQGFELRAYDVPMKPLRLDVNHVAVGKQAFKRRSSFGSSRLIVVCRQHSDAASGFKRSSH